VDDKPALRVNYQLKNRLDVEPETLPRTPLYEQRYSDPIDVTYQPWVSPGEIIQQFSGASEANMSSGPSTAGADLKTDK
jgi:hypothetical protein